MEIVLLPLIRDMVTLTYPLLFLAVSVLGAALSDRVNGRFGALMKRLFTNQIALLLLLILTITFLMTVVWTLDTFKSS